MICMTCATQKRPGTHGNTYLRVSSIVRNRRCLLHYDMAKVSWGSICGMVASKYASVEPDRQRCANNIPFVPIEQLAG